MTDVPTIVALRSLDQQERELAELRSRTNTVIAAAALIASFLGAAAIREHSRLDALGILALAVLVMTGGLSLSCCGHANYASRSTPTTYEDLYPLLDDPAKAQLRVAYGARDRYTHNKKSIDQLELAFQAACSCSAYRRSCGHLPSR